MGWVCFMFFTSKIVILLLGVQEQGAVAIHLLTFQLLPVLELINNHLSMHYCSTFLCVALPWCRSVGIWFKLHADGLFPKYPSALLILSTISALLCHFVNALIISFCTSANLCYFVRYVNTSGERSNRIEFKRFVFVDGKLNGKSPNERKFCFKCENE